MSTNKTTLDHVTALRVFTEEGNLLVCLILYLMYGGKCSQVFLPVYKVESFPTNVFWCYKLMLSHGSVVCSDVC